MQTWQLQDSKLSLANSPQPAPGAGELLIRIKAAGVTATEFLWYPTTHTKSGEKRLNAIPGHEFSGIVDAVGAGASGFKLGDEIFGMNDWFADGATAEFCITRPEWITFKPTGLSHAQAASVPIGALTAWQGLYDRAKLQPGERVLIHGGSGAVGVYAIQLAKRVGAKIITTASARNGEFLLQLGADQVIDYHTENFESLTDLDVVFDAVGGSTLHRSWKLLKTTGRMVTIAADAEGTADARAKGAFFIVESSQKQLAEIANLLETKQLQTVVDAEVPFTMADAAYAGRVTPKTGCGKVVITGSV